MIRVRADLARSIRSAAANEAIKLKPAAFLFDLDGTLVDTEAAWTHAIVDLIVSRGGKTTFDDILPNVIGRNWLDINRMLHERFPEMGDTSAMEDAVELRQFYEKYASDPKALRIEGTIEFFKKASKVAPCAIVSGSPHDSVAAAAEMCGLSDITALILGAGEYEEGKPSPSGFLRAAEILKVDPKDCVVIEDSEVGVTSGVAAGMKVVGLDRARIAKQHFTGETWRVSDMSELDFEKEFT